MKIKNMKLNATTLRKPVQIVSCLAGVDSCPTGRLTYNIRIPSKQAQ
jgi:ferredoxin